jgi:hypothetical protein
MNINGFEDLKDLSLGIEDNTQGEMSTHLGNNVNAPIDDGIGMYNRAVNDLYTYGDHQVSMNESVDRTYDINQINSNIGMIDKLLTSQLKKINEADSMSNSVDTIPHINSALGLDDVSGDELKSAMDGSRKVPQLATEITIKDKSKFLTVLKQLFKNLPDDELTNLISGISAFISEYDITGVRELINEVKNKAKYNK